MTFLNPPAKGGYQVVGQQQTTAQVPGTTQFVQGVQVNFVTGYGVSSSVFIPQGDYNVDTVQAAIVAKVAQLDAVSKLSG